MTDDYQWIKSRKTQANNACVEMAGPKDAVLVRDTKQQGQGPILHMSRRAFSEWLDGAKGGELDHLIG